MDPSKLNLNPITQIDPVLIVAVIVIFIATYFALSRLFVYPYLAMLAERRRLVSEAQEAYQEADDTETAADREAQRLLDDAGHKSEELRAATRERCDSYERERMSKATAEASAILEKGRTLIATARAKEADTLRAQVTECVGIACKKLLGRVEPDVVTAAVERAMARRMG